MKVVFTGTAEVDLETIGGYIALSDPFRAVSFVREIQPKYLGLRDTPHAFPLLQNHESSGIRVHGNYLILYRIGPQAVETLRVLHGAREYEQLLFPEGRVGSGTSPSSLGTCLDPAETLPHGPPRM